MDWSKKEVELIVADYFNMLQKELSHVGYNKSQHRQALLPLLENRSNGSVEFKHQNISAVLAKMGLPHIRGYKQKTNFQGILEEEIAHYVRSRQFILEKLFQQFVDEEVALRPYNSIDYDTVVGDVPIPIEMKEPQGVYRPIKTNYLEREQNNRLLGEGGEQFVLNYERSRLTRAGKEDLVDRIKWVAKEMGDGLGYDILSKNEDGTDRYVEVKTTKLPKETPFYVTKNEIKFASEFANNFFFYRVYNFGTVPQVLIKQGKYETFCDLHPETFKGNI